MRMEILTRNGGDWTGYENARITVPSPSTYNRFDYGSGPWGEFGNLI